MATRIHKPNQTNSEKITKLVFLTNLMCSLNTQLLFNCVFQNAYIRSSTNRIYGKKYLRILNVSLTKVLFISNISIKSRSIGC